ncbi:UNVERIFIED_CONTAM: hypothetical protein FKN15_068919 [Acipenser sinensis]
MAKRHILVDPTTPKPKHPKPAGTTNWELCVLCQKEAGEAVQCPAKSTKAPIDSTYKSLAGHLSQFQELGHMPMDIDPERLNDGDGMEATMMTDLAGWHKTCRLKFNQRKLELQRKSREERKAGTSSAVHTLSKHGNIDLTEPICFLCDEPAGSAGLYQASTNDIDLKFQRCAMELQDTALLAKLAPGDMIALEAKYHLKCLVKLCNRARVADSTDR